MSKQQYILMILESLENVWPLAKDLKRFLLMGKFYGQAMDGLVEILSSAVQQHLSGKAQQKLSHSLEALIHLRDMEAQDKMNDEVEIAKLEDMLQHL